LPGAEVGVGGDWYDLFVLPSGQIGIAIGDVAGSGLHAAVVMGRIRSALRAYALETSDPADVLTRLDRKVQLFEPGAMATAIYAVLEPDSGKLVVSSAGHLAPLLTTPAAPRPRRLDIPPDLPLGAYARAVRRDTITELPPGACLFLYTDGLVERRDRSIANGVDILIDTLTCEPANTVCATAMATMFSERAASDDVAVLAVRRLDPDADPPS
jgi:serine phosphatase RsbU (regulator of sigma subunit)